MAESSSDKYSRVTQMVIDDGGTWDLSPNDREALRYVLGMINAMADELARYRGATVPDVKKAFSEIVERGDE